MVPQSYLFLATILALFILENIENGTLIINALQVEVDESGFSETFDMTFNLDLNLQRMQEEEGDEILIMDFSSVGNGGTRTFLDFTHLSVVSVKI